MIDRPDRFSGTCMVSMYSTWWVQIGLCPPWCHVLEHLTQWAEDERLLSVLTAHQRAVWSPTLVLAHHTHWRKWTTPKNTFFPFNRTWNFSTTYKKWPSLITNAWAIGQLWKLMWFPKLIYYHFHHEINNAVFLLWWWCRFFSSKASYDVDMTLGNRLGYVSVIIML